MRLSDHTNCMGDETTLLVFGLAVKRIRMQAGLTQDELAQRCTQFKQHIPHIENGTAKVTLAMVIVLANAPDMQPSDLLMEMAAPVPTDAEPQRPG